MLALENIDWAVAYHVEKAVTAAGFFPNKDAFLPANLSGFNAAIAGIVANKGFIMEVFGTANYTSRAETESCNIIIQRVGIEPSKANITRGITTFEPFGEGGFTRAVNPQTTYDIEYEIRFICESTEAERAATSLLLGLFDMGLYFLPVKIDTGLRVFITDEQQIFIKPTGQFADLSGEGYIEKMFKYKALSVGITPQTNVSNVPEIEEITINLAPN